MCGIIGIIGKAPVTPVAGRRAEAPGISRLRFGRASPPWSTATSTAAAPRASWCKLEERLAEEPLAGTIGIGHTRWATHGKPSERNAHPIATDRVAIVHNGIIENFQELKDELVAEGRRFDSDTDTEVVAQLLTSMLERQMSPEEAMGKAMERLRGAFALVALFSGRHDILMGARRGSSLAVGYGDGEMYVGTDALALAPFTKRVSYLEDDDWVVLKADGCKVYQGRQEVKREIRQSGISGAMIGKGNHRHFMLKEIYEQPAVIGDTLQTYLDPATRAVSLPALPFDWNKVSRAHHDRLRHGLLRRHGRRSTGSRSWRACRSRSRSPRSCAIASRRCRRAASASPSRSRARRSIPWRRCATPRRRSRRILSVVNVPESAIARESHVVLPTLAGPEIGVASTKAFTTQLTVLLTAAIAAGRARGTLSAADEARLAHALIELPAHVNEALNMEEHYRRIAEDDPRRGARRALSGPRLVLSDRARGRAEAQGDLLHPRRGLCRRRDEARADRADRRVGAGRRGGAERRASSTRSPPTSSR